jgi:hypothetical protein
MEECEQMSDPFETLYLGALGRCQCSGPSLGRQFAHTFLVGSVEVDRQNGTSGGGGQAVALGPNQPIE